MSNKFEFENAPRFEERLTSNLFVEDFLVSKLVYFGRLFVPVLWCFEQRCVRYENEACLLRGR